MSDKVPGDVGKYLKLSSGSEVVGTKKGEICMCISHSVHETVDFGFEIIDYIPRRLKGVTYQVLAGLFFLQQLPPQFTDPFPRQLKLCGTAGIGTSVGHLAYTGGA